MTDKKIRQPIVTVCGHVDHGKTSLLDQIRCTSVAACEAGGITQKISFTSMNRESIKERAGRVLEKFKIPLEIPGFLFIDTPGHAAFTNLRKRGGSLADIAVLVIDINEGIKPQTAEVLQILKANKTPFIVALNKLDNISGWRNAESKFFFEGVEKQGIRVRQEFDEKVMMIIAALQSYKFDAEIYTKIGDFTKNIALVPCSARTGEGISEILAILCALSQKFLKNKIAVGSIGKGVILEVKKEKTINYLESILYDGALKKNDEIAIASFDNVIVTKIRILEKALPLNSGYMAVEIIDAASGIRMQATTKEEIFPGMPFQVVNGNISEIEQEFKKELSQELRTDNDGIIVKAESLGSLEALLILLKQNNIRVVKASIGNITKKDIYYAASLPEADRAILGFNSELAEDVDIEETKKVKVLTNQVVYRLIEEFEIWKKAKLQELERVKLESLPKLVKIIILPFVFRNTGPAIFGVRVDGGILEQNIELINRDDEKVGRVKAIQEEKTSLKEAGVGKEIAISVPGVNFERQLKFEDCLYSNLSSFQFKKFKENKNLLRQDEIKVLQEIAEVKRRKDPTWGM